MGSVRERGRYLFFCTPFDVLPLALRLALIALARPTSLDANCMRRRLADRRS
jgi:hypothetical protein